MNERLRRVLLWAGVAAVIGQAIWLAVLGDSSNLLGFTAFPVVGALILGSRPRNGVGWYLYGVALAIAVLGWTLTPELALLFPPWFEAITWALSGAFWFCLPVIGLLFPTGRPETRAGRVLLGGFAAIAVLNTLGAFLIAEPLNSGRPNPLPGWEPAGALDPAASLLLYALAAVLIVGVVIDLAIRFRRSTGPRRLQYRWLFYGLVTALATVFTVFLVINPLLGEAGPARDPFVALTLLAINFIPVCIGIAVTRHGLYEIGRVVSRTVSYALVTALVVGVYAAVVTSLSQLIPGSSSLAVAAATLVAAAVFLPALRFVRSFIDRRFDRERYDAAKVVDAFGKRLRTEVDPTTTTDDLLAAVEQTLQPAAVGLWTAGDSR